MRKLIAILTSLVVLSAGAAILATTAPAATAPAATAPAATVSPTATAPPVAAKPTTPKSVPPGAPQVPEESATIRDDRTIAPDPKQSADNNVSFPNDI
jgi:hypothetical protein